MESKDWVLTITEAEDQIDGTKVMFLAYEISKRKYEDSFALILEVLDAEIALKVLCALKSKWNGVRRKNQSVDWRPVTRIGEEGRAEGEDAISKFYFKLAEQNRMEDLKRAMTDKEFRKKLRAEVNV